MEYTIRRVENYRSHTGTPICFITLETDSGGQMRAKIWRKVSPVVVGHVINAELKMDAKGEYYFVNNTFQFADGSNFPCFIQDNKFEVAFTRDGRIAGIEYKDNVKVDKSAQLNHRLIALELAVRATEGVAKFTSRKELGLLLSDILQTAKVFEDYLNCRILFDMADYEEVEEEKK